MNIASFTRRQFLKAGCLACGTMLIGLRMSGKALAAAKQLKDYMVDRIQGVYAADAAFPIRASQDNPQVIELYTAYLKEPLGHKSHHLLHTTWIDKSAPLNKIKEQGAYPNPRAAEFAGGYPYE